MYGTTYRLITACKVQFFPTDKRGALIPCSFVLCTRLALLWILSRVYDSINLVRKFVSCSPYKLALDYCPLLPSIPLFVLPCYCSLDTYEMIYIARSFLSDKIKICMLISKQNIYCHTLRKFDRNLHCRSVEAH